MTTEMDRFRAARIQLIRSFVFFGSIAMSLTLREDQKFPAHAGTDGKEIVFNPELTKDWTFGEVVGVVCHEVMHVILLHHLRRGQREPRRWNVAGDHVINLGLIEQFKSFGSGGKSAPKLPDGGLWDSTFAGLCTEEVYDRIPEQDGSGGGGFDIVSDGMDGKTESQVKAEEARIKAMVQNAAALARKAGQMNGGLEKLVEAVCEPKAPWPAIVRDYLTERAETDYNWARPNQRMLQQYGVLYPTLDGEKLGHLVMIIDASGSCYNDQEQFCAEVSDILAAYECELDVIYHDMRVTGVDHYESCDLPIVMRPAGFGGTDPVEAYARAVEMGPDLIIHLTDLEMSYDRVEVPPCDVLIATTSKMERGPSWARVIDIS